jgi:hypothetical protein
MTPFLESSLGAVFVNNAKWMLLLFHFHFISAPMYPLPHSWDNVNVKFEPFSFFGVDALAFSLLAACLYKCVLPYRVL